MSLEKKIDEIAGKLHWGNSNKMLPITMTGVLAILAYLISVFQGLTDPSGVPHFSVLFMGIFCFGIVAGPAIFLFEKWVGKKLRVASKILAWDGKEDRLSKDELVESLAELIDFPHQFIVMFIIQWIITCSVMVLALWILYGFPIIDAGFLILGILSIVFLMSTFHYFVIKETYAKPLSEALEKFPDFYLHPELSSKRVSYSRKVLLYIMVLVASIVWITTHLAIVGQTRAVDVERDQLLAQRLGDGKPLDYLKDLIERGDGQDVLSSNLGIILGDDHEMVFLLGKDGNELRGNTVSDRSREIIAQFPWNPGGKKSIFSYKDSIAPSIAALGDGKFWKGLLKRKKTLAIGVTDRISHVYNRGDQYIVSVDYVGDAARLVTIQSFKTSSGMAFWSSAIMFGIALALALFFSFFMQRELMNSLNALIDSSKRVAAGDLGSSDVIMADDEVGELAVHHFKMVASLRSMVGKIADTSSRVDEATNLIAERTVEMARGSQEQSVGVEETSASLTQMNQTIGSIADSVDTLASSAEQSSASILEMSATNDQVATSSEQLSEAVVDTTASIEEMSATIKQVADNVQNTSDRASEAASSMREMNESVKKVDRIATESAGISEQVTRNAESGAAAVSKTIKGIEKIWENSRNAVEVIERLSKRAKEIGRILNVIEDVTEETNLLALNAAIIAAQAGEHGRGFAVVADEIKDLAERTQASTAEIAEQIQSVQKDATEAVTAVERGEDSAGKGVLLAEEAGEGLRKIQESAVESLEMARKISDSTREQNRKAERVLSFFESIAGMIEQIGKATQEQNRGSEQIIMAAEKMRDIATQVRKATKEQAQGSRQISQAIEHTSHIASYINNSQSEQRKAAQQALVSMESIADVATRNVLAVEKVSEAVSNLQTLAEDLKATVENFSMNGERNHNG